VAEALKPYFNRSRNSLGTRIRANSRSLESKFRPKVRLNTSSP